MSSTYQTGGQSLELYFVDGRPEGLVTAEMFNWTGHVLVSPRTFLQASLERMEADRSGVYILTGESTGEPRVYIGEGEDIGDRLRNHVRNKDWWDVAVLVTASDNRLNKAHVRYLEARLIALAAASAAPCSTMERRRRSPPSTKRIRRRWSPSCPICSSSCRLCGWTCSSSSSETSVKPNPSRRRRTQQGPTNLCSSASCRRWDCEQARSFAMGSWSCRRDRSRGPSGQENRAPNPHTIHCISSFVVPERSFPMATSAGSRRMSHSTAPARPLRSLPGVPQTAQPRGGIRRLA